MPFAFFRPIILKHELIVLFDNNGPDLNLLDPFQFPVPFAPLRRPDTTGLHNSVLY